MSRWTQTVEERFWSKVDRSGGPDACWPWTASIDKKTGYGHFSMRIDGHWKGLNAHRAAWFLTYGPLPPEIDCCHTCDFRPCCNLMHLFPGTRKENLQDASRKGRMHKTGPKGVDNKNSKLTDQDIVEIRQADTAIPQHILALQYGVHQTTIGRIQQGLAWDHVSTPAIPRGKGQTIKGDMHWSHKHPEQVKRGSAHPNFGIKDPSRTGELSPTSKLTDDDVLTIRALRGQETGRSLSRRFGVSPALICMIQTRKIWTHLLLRGLPPVT